MLQMIFMKKLPALLIAIIFIGALVFFLFQPKPPAPAQEFNFYNLPILIAVLIWACLKVWELARRKKPV
ncbi:MAG: hypothetical protein HYT19_01765 [Candidatus Nealsonbacteria bacterium]|nr:hypothetical protein [Candidatus Nealsonbacteria bacterium]